MNYGTSAYAKTSFQVEIEDKSKAKYNGNIAYRNDYKNNVEDDLKYEVSTLAIMRGDILITQTDDERGSVKAINPKKYPEPLVGPTTSDIVWRKCTMYRANFANLDASVFMRDFKEAFWQCNLKLYNADGSLKFDYDSDDDDEDDSDDNNDDENDDDEDEDDADIEENEEEKPKEKGKDKIKITIEKDKFLDEAWKRYVRLKGVYDKLLKKVTNCINFPEKSDLSFTSIP